MTCPTCGADVADGAAVCGVCGGAVASDPGVGASGTGASGPGPETPSVGASGVGAVPPPPPPSGPRHVSGMSSEARNWAMAAHLSSFAGAFMGGVAAFVGPLVVWLVKREEHPFIERHAREALNFNLSVLLYAVVSGVLSLVIIGIPMLIALFVVYVVFTVMAAVKASNGEDYRYPLTIRFVS